MEKPQVPDELINSKLDEINKLISPYLLAWVNPARDCLLLEKNARYMTKEQLSRLAGNIQSDGFLSQLPFGILENMEGDDEKKYRIISGNHRIKAAIKAKQERVLILYGTPDVFNEQKQLAMQLAHNAISGQDDFSVLKDLYSELNDLALKAYTGIDEKELFAYKSLDFSGISEQDIALNEVNFMFCDVNKENVDKVLDFLEKKGLDPDVDALVVGDIDRFVEIMTKVKARLNIKNRSVALLAMCRICEAYLNMEGEKQNGAI